MVCPDANLAGVNFPDAPTADVLNLAAMIADVSPVAEIAAGARHLDAIPVAASQMPCLLRPRDRNPPAS